MREAAQVMIVRDDFHVGRRVCHECGRTDGVLVGGKKPDTSQMHRPSLCAVIQRKVDDGALPTKAPPDKIHAGYGSGTPCAACGDPIYPGQVEYELNYPDEHRTFRLHLGCAGLWEAMRLKRGLDPAL